MDSQLSCPTTSEPRRASWLIEFSFIRHRSQWLARLTDDWEMVVRIPGVYISCFNLLRCEHTKDNIGAVLVNKMSLYEGVAFVS